MRRMQNFGIYQVIGEGAGGFVVSNDEVKMEKYFTKLISSTFGQNRDDTRDSMPL